MLNTVSNVVTVEIVTPRWDCPPGENLKIYLKQHPETHHGPGMAKDSMAGGVCIIDGSKVLVIVGSGDPETVALFSESEGFVRFFVRYYNLVIEWAKKTG